MPGRSDATNVEIQQERRRFLSALPASALIATGVCCALVATMILSYPGNTLQHNNMATVLLIVGATVLVLSARSTRWAGTFSPDVRALSLALITAAAVSTYLAPELRIALDRLMLYCACGIFGIALYALIGGDGRRTVTPLLFGLSLVHTYILILFLFSIFGPPMEFVAGRQSIVPYFSNPRHFNYFGFVTACCGISLAALSPRLPIFGLTFASTALMGIILLGSRGALLAWLVFAALMMVCLGKARLVALLCAGASVLAIGMTLVVDRTAPNTHHLTASLLKRADQSSSILMTSDRTSIWKNAGKSIIQRPWFGYGPEAYRTSRCCDRAFVHPHNAVLQFALEFGVVGVILASLLAMAVMRQPLITVFSGAFARRQVDHEVVALTSMVTGFLAYSMVDGLLYHALPLTLFAVIVSALKSTMARTA